MIKKLAVIGKGTAGCQSIIHYLRYMPECEIEWYFDPNIPAQSVGEGSTIPFLKNLFLGLNFNYLNLNKIEGSIKLGVYKSSWGNNKSDFLHQFYAPEVAFHFSARGLQQFVFDNIKDKVKIIEKNVSPDEIDADYVLSCAGKPNSYEKYYKSEYIPVNAAYITQCFWEYPRFQHTLTIARPYGWVFGIPLQNRCSIGYLYNRNINTESDVKEDVQNIFDRFNLTPSQTTSSLTFENYYKKQTHEKRVSYNGNASFFLEPLEATSIGTMDLVQRNAFDIWNGNLSVEDANGVFVKNMIEVEITIMLHYFAGSNYESDFWNFAEQKGRERIELAIKYDPDFVKMIRYAMSKESANLCQDVGIYGSWWAGSWHDNIVGLGIKDKLLSMI